MQRAQSIRLSPPFLKQRLELFANSSRLKARMKIPVLLLALVMLVADSATGQQTNGLIPAACGDNAIKFSVQQQKPGQVNLSAPADKALVYVIAQGAYIEKPGRCGITTRVGVDGRWIGANCEHTYLAFTVEPGEHHLCSNWQTKVFYHPQPASLLGFDAKAGSVYYFRTAIYTNAQAPLLIDLQPIDLDEARFLLSTAQRSSSHSKH